MKRIIFDTDTIDAIKEYAISHTMMECCNRFTLSPDVLKRVARENGFEFYRVHDVVLKTIPDDIAAEIRNLFENTYTGLHDIARQYHMKYDRLIAYLKTVYTQEEMDTRKHNMYRNSKTGEKNPMKGNTGEKHPGYVGVVADGKGYQMCLKPDWYTGRPGSKHVFLHSVVMCEHLGITEIPKGFVVHHIDHNPLNNDINNLALLENGAHIRLHSIERKMGKAQRLGKSVGRNPEMPDNDCYKPMPLIEVVEDIVHK